MVALTPELDNQLQELAVLLTKLPLPLADPEQPAYNFCAWRVNEEKCETYGSAICVLNQELEATFAPTGRLNRECPFKLTERGSGLYAIVDAFRTALSAESDERPQTEVLVKWVEDFLVVARWYMANAPPEEEEESGSEYDNEEEGELVGDSDVEEEGDDDDDEDISEEDEEAPQPKRRRTGKSTQQTIEKTSTKQKQSRSRARKKKEPLQNVSVWDDYEAASENEVAKTVQGKRKGRKPNLLLFELALPCRPKIKDPKKPLKKILRCVGMKPDEHGAGCDHTYAWGGGKSGRQRNRILKHAHVCPYVPAHLRERATKALGGKAISQQVKEDAQVVQDMAAGKKSSQTSIEPHSRAAKAKLYNSTLTLDILKLITVQSLPFILCDTEEWKTFVGDATHQQFTPPSSNQVRETLVPSEAAHVTLKNIEKLQKIKNLTLTFDGATSNRQDSIYTVHVMTPSRRVYLMKGHSTSAESHTGEHLAEMLVELIRSIGPQNFSAITSDDTGNTRVARKRVQEEFPWILSLPDCCHRLHNTSKDIGKLPAFRKTISTSKRVVAFFSKSTFAKTAFKRTQKRHKIRRGFVKSSKTRFAGIAHTVDSVKRCMPAVQELVGGGVVTIPDVNQYFVPNLRASGTFMADMTVLLAILMPIAWAITALESTHATVADVFLFFLAIMAKFDEFLVSPASAELADTVKERIRQILNYRWNQMIVDPGTNGPEDTVSVYVVGFMLHPGYRDNLPDVNLTAVNPLSNDDDSVTVSTRRRAASSRTSSNELPDLQRRVGQFLANQLRLEYETKKIKVDDLEDYEAIAELQAQYRAYLRNEQPFVRRLKKDETPYDFWRSLRPGHNSRVLAYFAMKLFAISPNSMADERAGSVMTRLGTALRHNLKAESIVALVQLREEFMRQREQDKPAVKLPTVKFHQLDSVLRRARSANGIETASSQSDTDSDSDDDAEDEWADREDGDTPETSAQSGDESDVLTDERLLLEDGETLTAASWVKGGNLKVPAILDYLSSQPLAVSAPPTATRARGAVATAPSGPPPKVVWSI
ncbi:unnamed protein product [Peniophora sp. CBMAI 1063]|nr:unnamed protein product [Peniophora sp. CBMAI 1063]